MRHHPHGLVSYFKGYCNWQKYDPFHFIFHGSVGCAVSTTKQAYPKFIFDLKFSSTKNKFEPLLLIKRHHHLGFRALPPTNLNRFNPTIWNHPEGPILFEHIHTCTLNLWIQSGSRLSKRYLSISIQRTGKFSSSDPCAPVSNTNASFHVYTYIKIYSIQGCIRYK